MIVRRAITNLTNVVRGYEQAARADVLREPGIEVVVTLKVYLYLEYRSLWRASRTLASLWRLLGMRLEPARSSPESSRIHDRLVQDCAIFSPRVRLTTARRRGREAFGAKKVSKLVADAQASRKFGSVFDGRTCLRAAQLLERASNENLPLRMSQ
jgi:hypothetical protein